MLAVYKKEKNIIIIKKIINKRRQRGEIKLRGCSIVMITHNIQ